jgi:hypothetical protein
MASEAKSGFRMNEVARPVPSPTAQIIPYYEVLGLELTVEFLLAFGGAELHLSRDSKGRSHLERLVGHERATALALQAHRMQRRVPLAKRWIAAVLCWQGNSTAEIARRLHMTDVSVRRWLKDGRAV